MMWNFSETVFEVDGKFWNLHLCPYLGLALKNHWTFRELSIEKGVMAKLQGEKFLEFLKIESTSNDICFWHQAQELHVYLSKDSVGLYKVKVCDYNYYNTPYIPIPNYFVSSQNSMFDYINKTYFKHRSMDH